MARSEDNSFITTRIVTATRADLKIENGVVVFARSGNENTRDDVGVTKCIWIFVFIQTTFEEQVTRRFVDPIGVRIPQITLDVE